MKQIVRKEVKTMSQVLEKLEQIATKILDSIEEKPIRTVLVSVLVIWVIGKVIKSLK